MVNHGQALAVTSAEMCKPVPPAFSRTSLHVFCSNSVADAAGSTSVGHLLLHTARRYYKYSSTKCSAQQQLFVPRIA